MVESIHINRRSRWLSVLCTLFISGSVLTILLLIILRTPIPPYPEGGGGAGTGIELNLGFSDAGSGNNPQELVSEPESSNPDKKVKTEPDNEKLLTQDVEDAPSIAEKTVKTTKPKKTVTKDVVVPPKKVEKKEPEKPKQVVNTKALYPARKNQQSADGKSNVSGDQGNPNGSLGAKAFGGQGGKGGSGGGTGGGKGTGVGPGIGPGISTNLKDRTPQSLPKPEYRQQVEGVVVVEVTVDKDGSVTQAVAGIKGSTTLDEELLASAKRAALQARFDRKPDAPAFQKGTITYRFRLQ